MHEVIRLDNVSLWRRTQEEFSYDLKKTVLSMFEGKYQKPSKRLVINDLSFSIQKGEKVGIIGANGAGKSTLLKLICGILKPSQGVIRVKGTISPLIELGAGFDSDLPVVDNIIMYGVMLGFSEYEMKQRTNDILNFADLEEYALAPVKALSSGMVARLGFAIATDVKPDILILDEVLSVGDESFKQKSKQRMNEFWDAHSTILVVSHSMEFIAQSCDKVLFLNKGSVVFYGSTKDAIHTYISSVSS